MGAAMVGEPADRKLSSDEYRMFIQLETSLLVWLRTSLGLMGFGFVIARFGLFLREIALANQLAVHSSPWLVGMNTATGTGLIVLGVIVLLLAVANHHRAVQCLHHGEYV